MAMTGGERITRMLRAEDVVRLGQVDLVLAAEEPVFLLRGSRLDQFAGWAEASTVALTPDESAYLEASLEERASRLRAETLRQAHEAALETRGRRFLRALVAVFAVASGDVGQDSVHLP